MLREKSMEYVAKVKKLFPKKRSLLSNQSL